MQKEKKSEHYPEQKPGIPLLPNINMHFASAFFFCLLQGRWLTTFFYHGGMVVSLGRRDDSWPVKLFIGTFVSLAVWGFLSTLMDIWQDFRRKVKQRRVMK